MAQLRRFAAEVTRVALEVGTEGQLGGTANVEGVRGEWKTLTDNVNTMARNLTNQVCRHSDSDESERGGLTGDCRCDPSPTSRAPSQRATFPGKSALRSRERCSTSRYFGPRFCAVWGLTLALHCSAHRQWHGRLAPPLRRRGHQGRQGGRNRWSARWTGICVSFMSLQSGLEPSPDFE